MCQKDCYHGPVNYLPMYVNKQILCNYNVDCNPQDFLFVGTDYVAVTFLAMLPPKRDVKGKGPIIM